MFSFRKIVSIQYLITIFILLSQKTTVNAFGINLIKVPDDDISQVICSMALLRKYYNSGESLSGSVLYMSLTKASIHTQKKLLEAIHSMNDFPWSIVIRDPKNSKTIGDSTVVLHEKPQCYFVIIENLEDEDLEDIFEDWKTTINWNPLAQFVVYLSAVESTDEEMTELMIEILLSFMNKKIFNVNVIGQSEENGYYYGKTAFPYHPDNNCGNRVISIEIIDVCDYHVGERTEDNNGEDSNSFGENDDEYENSDKDTDDGENEDGGENNNDEKEESVDEEESNNDNNKEEGIGDHEVDKSNEKRDDEDTEEPQSENNYGDSNDGDNRDLSEANTNDQNEELQNEGNEKNYRKNTKNSKKEKLDLDGDYDGQNELFVEEISIENSHIKNKEVKGSNNINYESTKNEISEGVMDTQGSTTNKRRKKRIFEVKTKNKKNKFASQKKYKAILKNKAHGYFTKHHSPIIGKPQQHTTLTEEFKSNLYKLPKFMRLETNQDSDDTEEYNSSNEANNEPHFFFEEIFRALFLDKFPKDLSGCPLTAAYRAWEPYIFTEIPDSTQEYSNKNKSSINGNDYDTDSTLYDDDNQHVQFDGLSEFATEVPNIREDNREKSLSGIEYQLLQTIGERLHMNIDLQVENTNLYHLFQELIDGDIEMLIGGIDEDPSLSQFVSTTIPYHQDDLTWCVAKAKRSYSLFSFLASFSSIVWLSTFLYIFVASITITWMNRILKEPIKHFKGLFSVGFRVYGSIFNQSMPINISRRPLRIVFFSTFFMGLIFMNAYQSFLISTLTTPKSAYQIKRIEEIYHNRMIIKGSVDNVRHLNKEGEIFKYIRENFQMCYNIEECLMEAAENENIAVAVSRQHSFYNPRIPRNRLYCFDRNENIYVYLVTMLLPKKFHLLHKINPVIQHVIESGHMQKWARDLDMRRRIREERNNAHDDEKFRSLTLDQVVGTFVFTGVLLGIAFMALMLEICVHRLATKRSRRRLKIVNILHRQFLRA